MVPTLKKFHFFIFPVTNQNVFFSFVKGFTTAQLAMVEENEQFVRQREEEISHIVQSIGDLNMIFKDLSIMIIDQVLKSLSTAYCKLFYMCYPTFLKCINGCL